MLYVLLIAVPITVNSRARFLFPLLWAVCLVCAYCKLSDSSIYFVASLFFSSLSLLCFPPPGLVHVICFGKEIKSHPFRGGLALQAENSWSDILKTGEVCVQILSNVCIHGLWTITPLSPLFQVCKDLDDQRFCAM